jgi:hypothetical protein
MALFPLFLLFEVLSGFTEAWPMCMYSVSPRQQGDPEGDCCDLAADWRAILKRYLRRSRRRVVESLLEPLDGS